MHTRTQTLRSGGVGRPPAVARHALRTTVYRTARAGLCHAVGARAHVPCTNIIVGAIAFCNFSLKNYTYKYTSFHLRSRSTRRYTTRISRRRAQDISRRFVARRSRTCRFSLCRDETGTAQSQLLSRNVKYANARVHAVPASSIVRPRLQDEHFTAPCKGQLGPVAPTPFSHEHTFTAGNRCKHTRSLSDGTWHAQPHSMFALVSPSHKTQARTRALGVGLVHRPPRVAHLALRSAVHRTTRAGLPQAVLACADVPYETPTQTAWSSSWFYGVVCVGISAHVQVHLVLSLFIRHPASQAAHLAAPFAGQSLPVCATPFLHVHTFTTKVPCTRALNTLSLGECSCKKNVKTYTCTRFWRR